MSKVSVTGSKRVMDDVVETVYDLHLLHLSEYDGSWEGFDPGDPSPGAESASEKLVTVRALESILGIEPEDAGPSRIVTNEEIESELEEIRQEANELDDRRDELRDELRSVRDRIETMRPFADVGIDLDLLWGYDSLEVTAGQGEEDAVRSALSSAEDVAAFETYAGDGAVAVFVHPEDDATGVIEDALVGVEFGRLEIPEAEGSPEQYIEELRQRERQLAAELDTVEQEIEDFRLEVADFLLAVEEQLTIRVQKQEAPLSFATTDNAFVAEGWIPTERFVDLAEALQSAVGDHVEVEELERADYDGHGHVSDREPVGGGGEVPTDPAAADGGSARTDGGPATAVADDDGHEREPATDGGVVTVDDDPPVLQDNPDPVAPFELLTKAVGRPKYTELDPTIVLFLTFPVMFGFMIGDVGYGVIYTAIGYYVYANFDSQAFTNFGYVAMAAGVMTVLFGVLYGEVFGLHLITDYLWEPLLHHPPIEKGLSPATAYWARAWFVITALFGVIHMAVGYVFQFVEDYALHGVKEALLESGSWLLALNGLWIYVFSTLHYDPGPKPDLLFAVFNSGDGAAFELGFAGLPPSVGWVGVAMVLVGMALLAAGPTHELIEIHVVLAHALSYLRIAAVLLAKAGMAFAVNLLFFGAYSDHGEYHFMLSHGPEYVLDHYAEAEILFPGLLHGGVASVLLGVVVLVVGHIAVLLLGITSAGIQSIRLEYFEFFSKFYDGGGTVYSPLGTVRQFTTEK